MNKVIKSTIYRRCFNKIVIQSDMLQMAGGQGSYCVILSSDGGWTRKVLSYQESNNCSLKEQFALLTIADQTE